MDKITEITDGEKLAITRTSLAYDRTLLAWVRTSLGITGFGFTFHKFFEFYSEHGSHPTRFKFLGPREYALLLISCGNIALFLAILHCYHAKKELRTYYPGLTQSRVPFLALVIGVFGLWAMLATLFRL